jgi:hypothetical protein
MMLRWLAVACLWLIGASTSWAAIAGGTTVSGTNTASATITLSSIVTTGSDKYLLCSVTWGNTQTSPTSVVFNGSENLTKVNGVLKGTGEGADFWELKNPSSTTANVVVTFSAAPSIGISAGCTPYTGVDQTTPSDGFVSVTGSVNPDPQPTLDVTSATDDLVVDALETNGDGTLTIGGGQTQTFAVGNNNQSGHGSTEAGAGTVTMSWSALANFTAYAYIAMNMNPSAGAPADETFGFLRRRGQ